MSNLNKTKKITISGMTIAIYVLVMYLTQAISFGPYQIRIATSLYSLSYIYPFLIIPLGISNLISNLLMGGLGLADIVGGTIVGILTSFFVFMVRRYKCNRLFVIPIIILGPSLIVPIWLSAMTKIPYIYLVINLSIGQILPAILGYYIIVRLEKLNMNKEFGG